MSMHWKQEAEPQAKEAKTKRMQVRLTEEQKDHIEYAATLDGLGIGAFVVQAAIRAADEVIDRRHTTRLSRADSIAFAEMLLNPPEPNDALKRAVRRPRELFGE